MIWLQVGRLGAVWAEDASIGDLTTFHPFPAQYATTVGDDLMAMPPLLEVLVPDDDSEAAGGKEEALASTWLDRAATAVADELRKRVLAIQKLGNKVRVCIFCSIF